MNDGTVQERWCRVNTASETERATAVFCCLRFRIDYRIVGNHTLYVHGRALVYLNALFVALTPVAFDTTRLPPCDLETQAALIAMRLLGAPPERWATEAATFLTGAR